MKPDIYIVGWKGVRGSVVKLAIPFDAFIGPDPEENREGPFGAYMASHAFVLSGGGVSWADSSFRFVKGRWAWPAKNPKARWKYSETAIYFFSSRHNSEVFNAWQLGKAFPLLKEPPLMTNTGEVYTVTEEMLAKRRSGIIFNYDALPV